MQPILKLLIFLLSFLIASSGVAEPSTPKLDKPTASLTLTYLGNEGFLITSGKHKILIDALTEQDPNYILLPEDLHRALRRAEPPFEDVDLVLATHRHHDHFEPDGVAEHLLANPETRFISTPQAADALRRLTPAWDLIQSRVQSHYPKTGERALIADFPFKLDLLRLHHGLERRPLTENLGFLIEINGWKVLHIGDTEATAEDLAPYELQNEEIDIALVPSWYFARHPWAGVIEESVQPKHWVMMHLAPNWHREAKTLGQRQARERVDKVSKHRPEVLIFEEPLDRHTFQP